MKQKDLVSYKGYQIMAMSFQLIRSAEWEFKVIIFGKDGTTDFLSPHTFKTEEEALQGCVDYGKRIVDGEVPGCSVDDI